MNLTPRMIRHLAMGALASAALVTGVAACRREKPNGTHDLQKNQGQYMDKMDAIAKKLEAEEQAKKAKEGSASAPGNGTAAPPANDPKKPEGPNPDGGK